MKKKAEVGIGCPCCDSKKLQPICCICGEKSGAWCSTQEELDNVKLPESWIKYKTPVEKMQYYVCSKAHLAKFKKLCKEKNW